MRTVLMGDGGEAHWPWNSGGVRSAFCGFGLGRAGSAMAFDMDNGASRLTRNTLFVHAPAAFFHRANKVFLASLFIPPSMPSAIEDPTPPPTNVQTQCS